MHVIKAESFEEMSRIAANKVMNLVKEKPSAVLGLATGSTPVGLYRELIQDHRQNGTSYQDVRTVNLDEYVGLEPSSHNSYASFMRDMFFSHIDIAEQNTHIPNGKAGSLEEECQRYDKLIEGLGGVDLQVLGIGRNGHIGFNEPGTSFESTVHVVQLDQSTREANSRFFDSIDSVPREAITMGIASILKSKEILLLASGASKAEAIKQLFEDSVSEQFPASALKTHHNVTLIADQDALQLTGNIV
ncbi:glucosamine-6-phosphate deaminase [Peribacillus deserti]|uniref:Glucosamine-6-phosphate deaminase n=1 Tax=Peribacillus deserti TaxID=673318 RepID=A0A2N5M423_9BACI|nr:glucosamine-6-phosphate deaminase [Peribacillus deserti]PLT29075.1 glucosamine-6-phosphate deaminase [Peribacillus deserti]